MRYRIEYSPEAIDHLHYLSARDRALVLDSIDDQLRYEPTVETKNRKEMRPNWLATWELRIEDLRAYYDVLKIPSRVVVILAVGIKERDVVRIGGEVVKL